MLGGPQENYTHSHQCQLDPDFHSSIENTLLENSF